MKVIIYNAFWNLNKCKKLIGVYCGYELFDYCFIFIKNGFIHNEKSYATNDGSKKAQFYFKGEFYGKNFTNKSWEKFVKQLKFEQKMNIFK